MTIHDPRGAAPGGGLVEVLVCATCRHGAAGPSAATETAETAREGALLLAALSAGAPPEGVLLRRVECLSNCSHGCSVALRGPGRWSYVYGNLTAADAEVVLDGARRYRATPDGLVPWRERPEHFRRNCIARIPPFEAEDA